MLAFHILIANKFSPPCQHKNNDLEIMMSVMMQISPFSYFFLHISIFHSSDWQPELRDTALGRRSWGSNNRLPLKILQEKYLGGTQRYYKKYFGLTLQNITRKIIQLCHPYILQENFTGRSDKTEYLLKLFKRQLLGHDAIANNIKIKRK